jgi:hypothetical protein
MSPYVTLRSITLMLSLRSCAGTGKAAGWTATRYRRLRMQKEAGVVAAKQAKTE